MTPSSLTSARVLARHVYGAIILRDVRSLDVSDEEHGARTAAGGAEEQILRQRLERIADLARRMVEGARVNPQAPVSGIVGELVRIVEDAEG